jgi:hypothetical protein
VTRHRRSRLRSLVAGQPMCRCGTWLSECWVLNPPTTRQPAPGWDGPTVYLSEAPLLTPGQARRAQGEYRQCHDLD